MDPTLPWDDHGVRINLESLNSQQEMNDDNSTDDNDDDDDDRNGQNIWQNQCGLQAHPNGANRRNSGEDQVNKTPKSLCSHLPSFWGNSNKPAKSQRHSKSNCPLLIIGAGQMRTGTTSLKEALEILYGKPCYHMYRLVFELKQPHISKWIRAFREANQIQQGQDFASVLPRRFWDSIYDGHVAAVDYPTCAFYKELMQIYPQAKIILTVREPDSWVASCRATTASNLVMRRTTLGEFLINLCRGIRSLPELHDRMFRRALGEGYARLSDEDLRSKYIQWNEDVIKSVPPDRLLIYDVRQGWEPLCRFLQLPLPDSRIQFPHLNKRDDMVERLKKFRQMERLSEALLAFLAFSVIFMLFYFLYIFY